MIASEPVAVSSVPGSNRQKERSPPPKSSALCACTVVHANKRISLLSERTMIGLCFGELSFLV